MSKTKKRVKNKRPITEISKPSAGGRVKKRRGETIAALHALNKQVEQVTRRGDLTPAQRKAQLGLIKQQQQELGGIDYYQYLSKKAESRHGNFNSANWVVEQIKDQNISPAEGGKLSLLDVGALDYNYARHKQTISATYIDLHPQKPDILQADFLQYKAGEREVYDVVVLSLVLNFAGDAAHRGQMLRAAHRLCRPNAHLALVLPLACVENSRHMTSLLLGDMMTSLGFDLVTLHTSSKLHFSLYKKATRAADGRKFSRKKLKGGAARNNFTIVLS